jgi:pimeloyl-ACP methyl ester carboxylesterase
VDRSCEPVAAGAFEVAIFRPINRAIERVWLVVPGLNFAGPSDPRLDRFCRILAHSGALVFAPYLPDAVALIPTPRLVDDTLASLHTAFAHPDAAGLPLSVFTISFGSFAGFAATSHLDFRDQIQSLVVFGGFHDFGDAARFCLTGRHPDQPDSNYDPLNRPVIFINLINEMHGAPEPRGILIDAWKRYLKRCWGQPEMKAENRWTALARTIAAELPETHRPLFLTGCGLPDPTLPAGLALCENAFDSARTRFDRLNPQRFLNGIRCPVHLFHGLDDDVIPSIHSQRLQQDLGSDQASLHLTGLFGHTGADTPTGLSAMAGELKTMWAMLGVLSPGGGGSD